MELSSSNEKAHKSLNDSPTESIMLKLRGAQAWVEWDMLDEKVNKLSTAMLTRFNSILDEIEKNPQVRVVVLISRKPKIFLAGADIEEIKKLEQRDDIINKLKKAHEIFNRVEDFKVPVIAAVDGACLGGGCELILACDYRICTDSKETKIGLPETKLGIIPGFGGCVRLPRVIGLEESLKIILAGSAVPGAKALKLGLVDECVPQALLEARVGSLASEIEQGKKTKRQARYQPKSLAAQIMNTMLGRQLVVRMARQNLLKTTKGFYPAPEKALAVIAKTWGLEREKSIQEEMAAFAEVAVTDVSKRLIDLFFMMESVKKQSGVADKNVKSKPVDYVGVLGAGVMGGGIAYVTADAGIRVRLKDITLDALALGFRSARELWEKLVKKKRLNRYDFNQKLALVSGGTDLSGFGQADVVIEAIVEDMNIKKKVIAEAAKACRPDCIMATNTSSLSVTEMAEAHPHPENFLGMHFFNPVNKMPLVEVIRGPKTSDEATATIFQLAKKMGKTPVVVKDGPGFLVNRLLVPFMGEALYLLEEGMAVDTLDRYYTHGLGMPMGPCRLLDEVGLDVGLKVLKIFQKSFGSRMPNAELGAKIESTGRLGRKGGKGFYLYDEKGQDKGVDPGIYRELGLSQPRNKISEKECIERGLLQMINEAARALLEDHIVETPQEVDLAMIMGTGFPPFRGGLLRYADHLGSRYIVQELEILKSRFGLRFEPCQPLVNLAKSERSFY